MDKPEASATSEPTQHPTNDTDLPPGNHALEIAARRGIGPLSGLGRKVWHGQTRPCVSCGQLVLRDALSCAHCGQDLSNEMIEKMRAHAGPWYVLEHVRPFPGVSLERIIRQVRRGLLTETSIVRGPSTDYQWRFAVETPGLCRFFGRCWNCHEKVTPSDTCCRLCLSSLSFDPPQSVSGTPPVSGTTPPRADQRTPHHSPLPPPHPVLQSPDELRQLSAVVNRGDLPTHEAVWDVPPRLAGIRATWIAAVLLLLVIVVLTWFTQSRSKETAPLRPATPGMVLPRQ